MEVAICKSTLQILILFVDYLYNSGSPDKARSGSIGLSLNCDTKVNRKQSLADPTVEIL